MNSTDFKTIKIKDKFKEEATWEQIMFCKSLDLDLKMKFSQNVKRFILEKIRGCKIIKLNEFRTFYQENGETLFVLDSKSKVFWFSYEIEQVLKEKYYLKYIGRIF